MSEDEKKAKRSKKATTNGTVGLFDPMTLRGVTVRNRHGEQTVMSFDAFAAKLRDEVDSKALEQN